MSNDKARELTRRICVDCQAPYCGCKDNLCGVSDNYITAALAAEREAGWRAGVEAAARLLPEYAAAIRALPYPAPTAQAEPAATSGGGQPADRARWYLALSDDEARQHATETIAEEFAEAVLAAEARVAELAAEIARLTALMSGKPVNDRWPGTPEMLDAGVSAYTRNYGPHGLRETLMAVWNAMARAALEASR